MKFSQRYKYKSFRTAIQTESLDEQTRNAFWNVIGPYFEQHSEYCGVYKDLWTDLYENTSDTRPVAAGRYDKASEHFYRFYRKQILEGEWYDCFDLIEFLVDPSNTSKWRYRISQNTYVRNDSTLKPADFMPVLERYMVGYRFVDYKLVPITTKEEITAIEEAIVKSEDSVAEQLSKAVGFLSNRQEPDYAKSIDCSISAVESQCRHLLGTQTPTLGKALKLLEDNGIGLHGSLKSAFEKLFGFTSDASGIRHGGLQPSDADVDLAKFMLVSCSAFVNYLKSKQP